MRILVFSRLFVPILMNLDRSCDSHLYVASYFIVGRIIEGKKEWDPDRNWYISFEVPRDDHFIPEGFPKPVLQLDCVTLLPWIMEEPY
ncbi:hypothetical protein ACWH4V_18985 [Bacillus mojavensis]|uniref:hypothetical protein n=1 Tax=Bacillus sp. LBG-1-113 TaxID=2886094 RepID=UPI001E485080|nr:hypothetical protein [Bacillus sp. LBG-1-113]MCC2930138.1 hypothetical protein [Bacillus sp. LBG-1-113]